MGIKKDPSRALVVGKMADNKFKQGLLDSVIALHEWRESYNGNKIGFGSDAYVPDKELHYPHAYALWGQGYLNLFQFTGKKKFLSLAKKSAGWLIKNKSPRYRHYSWGLPFSWKGTPKELSYLITTIYAGNLFLSLHDVAGGQRYLDIAESAGKWAIEENGFVREKTGVWFRYANHPNFPDVVNSLTAKASGFFSRLWSSKQDPIYKDLATNSTRHVLNNQNEDGSWFYSFGNRKIDNVHTALTLDGLCNVYQSFPSISGLKEGLIKAHKFYWNELYTESGYGLEAIGKLRHTLGRLAHKVVRLHSIDPETRLSGYGSGIRSFTKISQILGVENKGTKIARYVIENLQAENGAFRFKSSVADFFIRDEAHIFNGLSYLFFET